jgi:hypothetical protein
LVRKSLFDQIFRLVKQFENAQQSNELREKIIINTTKAPCEIFHRSLSTLFPTISIKMARSRLQINTPQTPVAAPYKISRRERVAFEKSESKEVEMSEHLYVQREEVTKEQIDEMTAAILNLAEGYRYLDEQMKFNNEQMTLKSRDDDSTLLSRSTWDEDTLSLDETVSYEPVWKTGTQSFASTPSASIKKNVALLPAILSFASCVACQDNDIYRYDDASTTEDMSFRSVPVDDETVLAVDLSELDNPPLKASRDPQVIPREVALINSFSSEMPKEGENHSLLESSNEEIDHDELSHPPENNISHALEVSKNDKESLPPRPKSPSIVSGAFSDGKDSAGNITPTRRGSKRLLISRSLAQEVSGGNDAEHFVETKQSGGAPAHERNSWTLGNLRSASPLFVKQDAEKGSLVGTSMSQPKKCTFNLTKVSFTFDEQGDGDCDALAGGARNERPVLGASVSQINGETTEQPNAVDTDANSSQLAMKAKGWKLASGARNEIEVVGVSVSEINGKTTEQPNAVDTDANSSQLAMKAKGWKLAGGARNERPVVGAPVSQTNGKTTEQPNAVDTDANSSQLAMKAKGWKFDLTNFSITSITFDGGNADADAECQALFVEARSGGQVQEEPVQEEPVQEEPGQEESVQEEPVQATPTLQGADEEPVHTTPTLQDADQPDDQMESEGIEVSSIILETKKTGWKVKWCRRGK